ncbi:ATP-dependent DNA ligase [Clostridium estertheticum]|uniref:ATP-dependent DNA ligase n=1 Tax=Clostridium estertheticum TaxID=238834 RepID=UPI00124C82D3|nr:RNA ligase family protein [Clostridium estertheticum]MBZ9618430.1 DNA ligase [Clostridium estertheticum subsp. laramiense]WAG76333.1 DNA ligase [Clostridium estertheticum]
MDIFENKNIKPMLIGENQEAFDSPDYIYELKLDGERCIAYLDKDVTELRNKRNMKMLAKVPELSKIHKQVKHRCILDGELIIIRDRVPDFYEIRRRSLMSNTFKIQLASSKLPASFTAFDILYYDDHSVTDLPLMQRKKLLEKVIKENERIAVSRYIEEQGIKFYQLAKQNNLEGIVAKRKDSKYYLDKKTKNWIKIKYLLDDDFVICGYIHKDGGVISIVLGQYFNKELVYKGHVTLGLSTEDFQLIKATPQLSTQPFNELPSGNENAVWLVPKLVCIVKFMMKTANGGLRQPVFKGIREDKSPKDCTI